jgi:hypothetical protein
LKDALAKERRNQSQYRHRRSGKSRSPEGSCSYLGYISADNEPRLLSKTYQRRDECGRQRFQRVPFRLCSGHEHLPYVSAFFIIMFSLELQLTVVSSIFLAADQQFGVEKLAIASGTDLINRLSSC